MNADSFTDTLALVRGASASPVNTIGYWAWELEEFPEEFVGAFRGCAEVWTPSTFCQRAIQQVSPVPVIVIPHPLNMDEDLQADRAEWGIGPGEFVFLCMADMLSIRERKNPDGAIAAFLARREEMPNAKMIVKVNNGYRNQQALQELQALEQTGAVRVIAEDMSRDAVNRLLASVDCFVSLHRAEGFGLPMAESMWLGKPVIATRYSGNLDFMDDSTAFMVDIDQGTVPEGCAPYKAGSVWAEPSIESASNHMVTAYSNHGRRTTIAKAGQLRIRGYCSPERYKALCPV